MASLFFSSRRVRVLLLAGVAAALSIISQVSAAAETTISQPIVQLRYSGNWDITYFVGPARWGSACCPNALHAQVLFSNSGRKQLLAVALSAKAAGSKVNFHFKQSSPIAL